jgi:hypothetical protein
VIFNHPNYAKLLRWAKEQLEVVFNMVITRMEREHHYWTHVVDGVRMSCDDPRTEGRAKEISETCSELSGFCYWLKLDGMSVFVPYSEEQRAKDIESGRLTGETLEALMSVRRDVVHVFKPMSYSRTKFEIVRSK